MRLGLWLFGSWLLPWKQQPLYDYDLCIIGGGAAGLFASGAASLFTNKTLLLETQNRFVGGDCTNSACVPSKALRAIGKRRQTATTSVSARDYVWDTVRTVRAREGTPSNVEFVANCAFLDPFTLQLRYDDNDSSIRRQKTIEETRTITARRFLIATGARPIVPPDWNEVAQRVGLPLSTYKTLLCPESNDPIWNVLETAYAQNTTLIVAGGGATACELLQSLSRAFPDVRFEWVAPGILPGEDPLLRQSALELLLNSSNSCNSNIHYHPARVTNVWANRSVAVDNGQHINNVDALLLCLGRIPNTELLQLDRAKVKIADNGRILVNNHLRTSASHIVAAGDCCVTPPRSRSASQAAWTGFHAVRNLYVPRIFRIFDDPSIQYKLPRVVYTDPELACVGLTRAECVERFGKDGFRYVNAREEGMDRADIEREIRNTKPCFVELRSHKVTGRILGCTVCGPAAAEIANSMGIAMTNHLSVSDLARSPHSYPSHGYLLYRVALSMSLGTVWGVLEATLGPFGRLVSSFGRRICNLWFVCSLMIQRTRRRKAMDSIVLDTRDTQINSL